jgi:hypothetical protein
MDRLGRVDLYLLLRRTTVWGVDDQTIVSIQTQDDKDKVRSNTGGTSGVYRSACWWTRSSGTLQAPRAAGPYTGHPQSAGYRD